MSEENRNSLACPVCDSTDLGVTGRLDNESPVNYRCKECAFMWSATREALARAGVPTPYRRPRISMGGSFERAKSSAGTRITVSGRNS